MNILITGGTGLIGRALCKTLLAQRHALTVLSRQPATVGEKCGAATRAIGSLDEWRPDERYDAVINLAGEQMVGARWSEQRKKALWDSRVSLTTKLLEKIAQANSKPDVLLSGSAVGIYGDCGERPVDEESEPAAADFGARLCADWEREALKAHCYGIRTCLLRTGLVLSRDGGLLPRMAMPFRLGLGARIGNGRQWMSWIHIEDQVAIMVKLLSEPHHQGAFNLCAPNPVNNATFTKSLAAAVKRPSFLFVPAPLLGAALGESARLLLGGQKVLPSRIEAAGYRFRYPTLAAALAQLA